MRTLVVLALAALLLLAGCSGSGTSVGGSEPAPAIATGEAAPAADARSGAEDGGSTGSGSNVTDLADRKIARTASVTLSVDDPAAAVDGLHAVAEEHSGLVLSEYVDQSPGARQSRVSLSVPADQLDAALDDIAGAGQVITRSVSADDVTGQVVDIDARVKTMRDSIARLQELMQRAGSLKDVTDLESELTQRQADLESLLAQQSALSEQVARSTISVTLVSNASDAVAARGGFLAGLVAGWRALLAFGRVLVTAAGALLPWLPVAAVVAVPVWWWRRRRSRAQAQEPAEEEPTGDGQE